MQLIKLLILPSLNPLRYDRFSYLFWKVKIKSFGLKVCFIGLPKCLWRCVLMSVNQRKYIERYPGIESCFLLEFRNTCCYPTQVVIQTFPNTQIHMKYYWKLKSSVIKPFLIYTWLNERKVLGKMYHNHFVWHRVNYKYVATWL